MIDSSWKQDFVEIRGGKLHYTRTAPGSGKPVIVLAHGFSDYGLNWAPLVPHLPEYDFVLPDARGHGLSARAQAGEPIDLAADLAELIQALGLERPVVGGHSMGGYTAGALAARYPGLARALILEDPAWFDRPAEATPQPRKLEPWMEWLLHLEDLTVDEIAEKGRRENPAWLEEEFSLWAESKKQFDPNFIFAYQIPAGDWRDTVRALTVPTLMLTAEPEKGSIITPQMAAEISQLSPLVTVAHIPGVGHCIRREAGPAYVQAVREFLGRL